jgi:hypothetical protein
MLERAAPRVEQKSAAAAIGRSPDQIAALRLAALLMLANAVLSILVAIVFRTQRMPIVQIVLSIFLSYYLYTLRPRAEALALGLAVLAAIVQPILYLRSGVPIYIAVLESLPALGTAGALTLLLTGDPNVARRAMGVTVFCVFNVGFYVLLMLLRFSRHPVL